MRSHQPGGPAGDRRDDEAGAFQPLQRGIGRSRQAAVIGQRIVYVREHDRDVAARFDRHVFERPQHQMPASIGSTDMAAEIEHGEAIADQPGIRYRFAIEGQGQADILRGGRRADGKQRPFELRFDRLDGAQPVADRQAIPSASLRLSLVRRAPVEQFWAEGGPAGAPDFLAEFFDHRRFGVPGRRELQRRQRQHALLQPGHGQRRHRDVLAVIGLQAGFRRACRCSGRSGCSPWLAG